MDKSPNKEELIDRYLTGMADEAEVEQLDAWLKEDEQLRQTFLSATRMDSHLRERALEQPAKKEAESSGPPTLRFRWFNPGAAAGLLIGLFSASVVWAAIPQAGGITRTSEEVVTESFEDPDMKLKPMLPNRANQWFGPLVSVAPEGGVTAVEGSRVGQLSPNPGYRSESVRYVVDLNDYPELGSEACAELAGEGVLFCSVHRAGTEISRGTGRLQRSARGREGRVESGERSR